MEVKANGTQTTIGSGLSDPTGVAVDGSGNVFIADFGNNRVLEVKARRHPDPVGSGLNGPFGVAVDSSGDACSSPAIGNNQVVQVTAGVPVTVSPATPMVRSTP